MYTQLGIDIGSGVFLVSVAREGIVLRDTAVIAQDRETGRVVAVGNAAEQKLNMPGQPLAFSRPFRGGLLEKPDILEAVLRNCLASVGSISGESDLLMAVPCDMTDMQEELLASVAKKAGAKDCHLIYAPLAAMAGTFMHMPRGCLVVDIGGTSTQVMLLCRGRIYYMKCIPYGGQHFDKAIADYLWKKRKVRVTLRVAESIKNEVGSVWAGAKNASMEVKGKDHADRPVIITVTSAELYGALEEPIGAILQEVWVAVSKIPSEYVKTVFDLGIQLCGGGSILDGLDKMIGGVTGVATRRVEDPVSCTAMGLSEILAQLPPDLPSAFRNISEIYIKKAYQQTNRGDLQ